MMSRAVTQKVLWQEEEKSFAESLDGAFGLWAAHAIWPRMIEPYVLATIPHGVRIWLK